jgi:tRNA(adenine34) deaminase
MGEGRDREHLRRAIDLARAARERGNQPFGAVLVGPRDVVIVEAENTEATDRDCTAHAEMNLVRLSGTKAESRERAQCTLYASTDPCLMCAGRFTGPTLGASYSPWTR